MKIWNTETMETRTNSIAAESIVLSPDGEWLLTSGRGQPLRWWNLEHLTNASLQVEAMRFLLAPDNRTVAVFPPPFGGGRGSQPGPPRQGFDPTVQRTNLVQLWDLTTFSLRTNLILDTASIAPVPLSPSAAFSPDGKMLATVNFDLIQLWDVMTGGLLGTFTGHKQMVQSVAFAPDGKTLASAGDDSTLRLWNVTTRQELFSERRLGGSLTDLLFSPDGRLLVGSRGSRPGADGLRFYRAPLFSEIEPEAATQR